MFKCISYLSAILVVAVVCSENDKNWWKTATFYQIYPKSFKDTNGDGVGDLKGIIEKLDYVKDLGVTGVWLSPIYKSPLVDEGYDISDFRDINPIFGDLETFVKLINETHSRGLKIVLDYVPNHTSDQHPWFTKSENREEGYEDFFVWVDGKNGDKNEPPNNWRSVFKNSAWEWSDKRKQFYLHQFFKQQPDLNFFNDQVQKEMKDIINYWLEEYGIDGIRIDSMPYLVENQTWPDEPRSYDPSASEDEYEYLDHIYSRSQKESYDIIYDWRRHIDGISKNTSNTKVCMTEAVVDLKHIIPYYGTPDGSKLGAHFSFNFILLVLNTTSTASDLSTLINLWMDSLPKIYTSNWVLGNHDQHRIATKVGTEKVDGLNMLMAFLPGIQITYNGEEIGMENGEVNCETQGLDHAENCSDYYRISRDFQRTPFQWDSSEFAGFTSGNKTWLPVSSKKTKCNVADQINDERSHLNIYKKLQRLRPQWRQSEYEIKTLDNSKNVLQALRYNKGGTNEVQFVFNYGSEPVKSIDLNREKSYEVVISSGNSPKNDGDVVDGKSLTLNGNEALILKPKP
ncbi:maltase A1 [Diabrotica virgifera virgifera]|uniref:alpha-glucosidase n=1 Tax=Diabrotica virgifera virgifera TaxID=50390 RepID=A0A6P7F4D0_DIAVI|nr:maltase A1 [Diabrotica virgifera virgifera]